MNDWLLSMWGVLGQIGFWIALVMLIVLVWFGKTRHSHRALFLASAFVPSLLFFFSFQPFAQEMGQVGVWFIVIGMWGGILASICEIIVGIGARSALAFAMSAIFTFPMVWYFVAHPNARWLLFVPLVLLAIASVLYWKFERSPSNRMGVSS